MTGDLYFSSSVLLQVTALSCFAPPITGQAVQQSRRKHLAGIEHLIFSSRDRRSSSLAALLACLTFIKLLGLLNGQRIAPNTSAGIKKKSLLSCSLLFKHLLLPPWSHHPVEADTQSTVPSFPAHECKILFLCLVNSLQV